MVATTEVRERAKMFAENFESPLVLRKQPGVFTKKYVVDVSGLRGLAEEAFKAGATEANSQFSERRTALFDRRQVNRRGPWNYRLSEKRKKRTYDVNLQKYLYSRRNGLDERGFRPKEFHELLKEARKSPEWKTELRIKKPEEMPFGGQLTQNQKAILNYLLTEQFILGHNWVSSHRSMPGNDRKRETKFANDKKDENKDNTGTSDGSENWGKGRGTENRDAGTANGFGKEKKGGNGHMVNTDMIKKVAKAAHNHAISAWIGKKINMSPELLKKKNLFAKVNSPEVCNAFENFLRVSRNEGQVVGMRVDDKKHRGNDGHQVSVLIKNNGNKFVLRTFGVPSVSKPFFDWERMPYEAYKKEKRA